MVRLLSKGEERTCAATGCEEKFIAKTFNQIYHDDECCRKETNRRVMREYYERKNRRLGKTRYCKTCGVTRLSRYNDSSVCASCDAKGLADLNNSVLSMLSDASLI